jgi:chorismate mutase/prephenate dehydratase
MPDLSTLRAELDAIDSGLVDLIARRLEVVAGIGAAKAGSDTPVRDPGRERAVLDAVSAAAEERGVPGDLVRRIFREIIGYAVDKQVAELLGGNEHPATVGFQGVEHAYSHLAAQKHLAGRGWQAGYRGYPSFAEVVAALVGGECDLAVLPVENTTAGSINQVYDLLQSSPVHVVGEETWRVDHALAALGDVPVTALTRVLSHPQGLEQCAAYLRTLPDVVPVTVFDTAEAMRAVSAAGDPTWAAIGSPEAADANGLVVLRRGITDQAENFTRFLVLAREPVVVAPRVPSKTSLVLVTTHEEGALLRCLELLAKSQHSMTKLESRPRPGRPFEYLFFLDFEGNVAEERTQQVLEDLRSAALSVKVLGSYPAKVVRADATVPADVQAADDFEALVRHDT